MKPMPLFKRIGKLFRKRELPKDMPEEVREQLKDLKDPEWPTRSGAVERLGEIGHPSAIPYLTKALRDSRSYVRETAAEALGRIKHESTVPHLIRALRDKDEDVRERAAQALGEIGHPSAIPPLLKAMQDPAKRVRKLSTVALGKVGHENAVHHLIKLLRDRSYVISGGAAVALVNISRSLKGKQVENKRMKALQFVGPYFHEREHPQVVRRAYMAALKGKITKENARLFVKQLRAVKGSLK